jgi:hypothetical protein
MYKYIFGHICEGWLNFYVGTVVIKCQLMVCIVIIKVPSIIHPLNYNLIKLLLYHLVTSVGM